MEELFEIFYRELRKIDLSFQRYLIACQINVL